MTNGFIQAFQQAPWRVQIQKLGLILLVLVILGLTAGLYLSITANTYAIGVQVQEYENKSDEMQRDIADLQTQKAAAISTKNMEKRAQELRFKVPARDQAVYILVPGYQGRQLNFKTDPPVQDVKHSLIKPVFVQSLWEFTVQSILLMGSDLQTGGL